MPTQSQTTHVITANKLIVYRRERSTIWQCRYKVGGLWQRMSTNERELSKAKDKAHELLIEAEIRKRENLPVVTRKFRNIAQLAVKRMEDEVKRGDGKVSYEEYIRVIEQYLIPVLGKRNIANIDIEALSELNEYTTQKLGHEPSKSTQLKHNAALNRIFDEAVVRGFLTEVNRPKLETKKSAGDRRPAFELHELAAVLRNFESWINSAKSEASKERREIMRDYVEILADTGARPGKELLNLRWNQIRYQINPTSTKTGQLESDEYGEPEEIVLSNLNQTVEMAVDGKTGPRRIIGRHPTVKALSRIAKRNYGVENNIAYPLEGVIRPDNNDFVLRTKEGNEDVSDNFQKMLESFLKKHSLLVDPITGQARVFYSFRHTYATLALTHDKVPIHTLAQQMGTSVLMIERHYSHLKVINALDQLRGEETRRLISVTRAHDELYKPKTGKK